MNTLGLLLQASGDSTVAFLINVLPIAAIFLVFYFLVIAPANKQKRKTQEMLADPKIEILFQDAMHYLRGGTERFDVVFLDPPFRQNALGAALELLPARLAAAARVYIEAAAPLELQAPWRELRRSRAGQVSYQLFELEPR